MAEGASPATVQVLTCYCIAQISMVFGMFSMTVARQTFWFLTMASALGWMVYVGVKEASQESCEEGREEASDQEALEEG